LAPRSVPRRALLRYCASFARCGPICTGTGLTVTTSAPGLGSPTHICTRTDFTAPTSAPGLRSPAATSAPGLRSPRPHLHRDWARPGHICTGTGHPKTSSVRRTKVSRRLPSGNFRRSLGGALAMPRSAASKLRRRTTGSKSTEVHHRFPPHRPTWSCRCSARATWSGRHAPARALTIPHAPSRSRTRPHAPACASPRGFLVLLRSCSECPPPYPFVRSFVRSGAFVSAAPFAVSVTSGRGGEAAWPP
jgi:hypothetical protein